MKDISEVTALVVDYGTFVSLAEMMAEHTAKTYYYSPHEDEYKDICRCCIGDGLETVERMDDFLDPAILKTIDIAIFPDIEFGGLQRHLVDQGVAVWGSRGSSDIELYRTRFMAILKELGLPMVPTEKAIGLTALAAILKRRENLWVKINRYRENMETWHHIDWEHSQRKLEKLALAFGPFKEHVTFLVQDDIPDAKEIGYDGWMIDGQFPSHSFQGYEKKNELYLGSLLPNEELPEWVLKVNEAMAPVIDRKYGHRNFWATEIRQVDDTGYHIDPTPRMAGQTMEHQYQTCTNLADIIWRGAHGELVEPEFEHSFAAEATIHYTGDSDQWMTFQIPESVRKWVKLYHHCGCDGAFHVPCGKNDEVGVIVSNGDSIEEAIEELKDHFSELEGEPLEIHTAGFADLLEQIADAEEDGIHFSDDPIPEPEIAVT